MPLPPAVAARSVPPAPAPAHLSTRPTGQVKANRALILNLPRLPACLLARLLAYFHPLFTIVIIATRRTVPVVCFTNGTRQCRTLAPGKLPGRRDKFGSCLLHLPPSVIADYYLRGGSPLARAPQVQEHQAPYHCGFNDSKEP